MASPSWTAAAPCRLFPARPSTARPTNPTPLSLRLPRAFDRRLGVTACRAQHPPFRPSHLRLPALSLPDVPGQPSERSCERICDRAAGRRCSTGHAATTSVPRTCRRPCRTTTGSPKRKKHHLVDGGTHPVVFTAYLTSLQERLWRASRSQWHGHGRRCQQSS